MDDVDIHEFFVDHAPSLYGSECTCSLSTTDVCAHCFINNPQSIPIPPSSAIQPILNLRDRQHVKNNEPSTNNRSKAKVAQKVKYFNVKFETIPKRWTDIQTSVKVFTIFRGNIVCADTFDDKLTREIAFPSLLKLRDTIRSGEKNKLLVKLIKHLICGNYTARAYEENLPLQAKRTILVFGRLVEDINISLQFLDCVQKTHSPYLNVHQAAMGVEKEGFDHKDDAMMTPEDFENTINSSASLSERWKRVRRYAFVDAMRQFASLDIVRYEMSMHWIQIMSKK